MMKHLQKPELTNFSAIWQKDILTLDGLEKEQLIQLDDVTRIKLALAKLKTAFYRSHFSHCAVSDRRY